MTTVIPSFLKPSTPAASPARSAGAARQALRDVRQDCKELAASLSAPAPTAVRTVGAYDARAWSLLQDVRQILTSLQQLLSGLINPSQPPAPTTPTPTPTNPTGPGQPSGKGPTEFVLSSFNVLSSSAGNGKGYASGTSRMRSVVQILKANDVSVVGMQEVDSRQLAEFKKLAGDQYGTVAGQSGMKGYHDTAIAWRKDTWKQLDAGTITVPSYGGRDSKVPYVRLKNRHTGQEAYFVDAHNPANTKRWHKQERFRDAAARMEADLVERLHKQTGLPVFLMGDMNSVKEAREIFTTEAPLKAANPAKKAGIDWIFGTKDGVRFSDFRRTREGLIAKTTDHPVVFTDVRIAGK